ncbi:MAG TPA: helix-turn-helix domain-containing protein [Methylomirabilota bacterium]|jgi:DNA-binding HxlR family transcriptional regulator|nr:helix-turn-helix domain-containing protein [Methylomirabilota bacterium]
MAKRYGQPCPVAKTLELIGDRWTLLIVRDLLPGTRRFQDLLESQPGLAPNILSDRLKLMEEHGLITRRFYSDHPPRAEYVLSAKGKELGVIVGALAAWGSRHVYRRARLVHAGCAQPVKLGYFCPDCGERVRGGDVRLKRGGTGGGRSPAGTRTSGGELG